MLDCHQGRFQQQIRFLRHQFIQDQDLPFGDVLSEGIVREGTPSLYF
jgi:hypothetical protein